MRTASWLIAALTAAAALAFFMGARPRAAGNCSDSIEFKVAYDPATGIIAVEARFRCETGSAAFGSALTQAERPWAPPPAGYFRDVRATDESGSPLEVRAENGGWTVQSGSGILRYAVDPTSLRAVSSSGDAGGARYNPFLYPATSDDYAFIPASSILLLPRTGKDALEDCRMTLRFEPPEDWEVIEPHGGDEIGGKEALSEVLIAAERPVKTERAGGIALIVAQPPGADPANLAAADEFAARLSSYLDAAAASWNRSAPRGGRLTLFLGPLEDASPGDALAAAPGPPGMLSPCVLIPVRGRENILSRDFLLRSLISSLRAVLGSMELAPDALWFREGAAAYSGLRIAGSLGLMSEEETYDRLAALYVAYLEALRESGESIASAGEAWTQEGAAGLLAAGGTAAAATLDARLSQRGLSLDAFIDRLLGGAAEDSLDSERLLRELGSFSGEDYGLFFRDHIFGTSALPASGFSALKVKSEEDAPAEPPLPSFTEGHKWIYMVITAAVVFSVPFLLEPYTLRPRRGSEKTVDESGDDEDEGEL